MKGIGKIRKAIVAALWAALTAATAAYPDLKWLTITTAALTPLVVYLVPNSPPES